MIAETLLWMQGREGKGPSLGPLLGVGWMMTYTHHETSHTNIERERSNDDTTEQPSLRKEPIDFLKQKFEKSRHYSADSIH